MSGESPPAVAIVVPVEGDVQVRLIARTEWGERRVGLDLDSRADVLGEIALALDALLITLRERRDAA